MRARYLNLLLVLAVASCGSGGPASLGGGSMSGGGVGNSPPPLTATVNIQDYSYSPGTARIKVGGTITWNNHGTFAHTVTGMSPMMSGQLIGAQGGAYGMPTAGGSYAVSFPAAGTYTYHCTNHAQMTGTVTVVP